MSVQQESLTSQKKIRGMLPYFENKFSKLFSLLYFPNISTKLNILLEISYLFDEIFFVYLLGKPHSTSQKALKFSNSKSSGTSNVKVRSAGVVTVIFMAS